MMHSFSRLLLTAIPVFAEAKTGSDTFYYIAAGVLTVLVLCRHFDDEQSRDVCSR